MEKEPQLLKEKNINPTELATLINVLLKESSQYNVDCLDLKDDLSRVVLEWFEEKKDELAENFKDFYPQTHPPKQELLDKIRPVFPLDRIHAKGVGLEFRRTMIIEHWVGEIYNEILDKIFKERGN